jgi:SAM-dependent methyltransferase
MIQIMAFMKLKTIFICDKQEDLSPDRRRSMPKALWNEQAPGAHLDVAKMPGHWLLAQLGKRVLRPGGRELTETMIEALAIERTDDVVELAPGMGQTAQMVVPQRPATYTGVDRDTAAVETVDALVKRTSPKYGCRKGSAEDTGLQDASADVVYAEAMLTMQTPNQKQRIVQEAHRILRDGGRYGIHELCLEPEDLPQAKRDEIEESLRETIRVGARPLTRGEWIALLEEAGFEVETVELRPMHLLEPKRLIADEGVRGAARFLFNVTTHPGALERVMGMRSCFRRHEDQMGSICLVARKLG